MVQSTFSASKAKDIVDLRRATNNGFVDLTNQINSVLSSIFVFSTVSSAAFIPPTPKNGDEMWINSAVDIVLTDGTTYTAGSVYKRLGTAWVDTGITSV